MKRLLAILLILGLALPVCAKKHQNEGIITPQTQLEKRKFQTRTYKAQDSVAILKSILNVLQDEGYLVYNVNSLLGFVYAVKDFDTTDPNIDISKEFGLSKSRLNYNGIKVATIETSANVTQYGDLLRVRINFKRKLLNEYGNAQFIDDVSENEFYENFYEKLDNALSLHAIADTQTETAKTTEPVIGQELIDEINDEVLKLIKNETPKIPDVTPQQEQIKEHKEAPQEEVLQEVPKEEETAEKQTKDEHPTEVETPAQETQTEEIKEGKEQEQQVTEETQEENSETVETPAEEEIIEQPVQKEKKSKKKKSKKNAEEIIEEETTNNETIETQKETTAE